MVLGIAIIGRRSQIVKKKKIQAWNVNSTKPPTSATIFDMNPTPSPPTLLLFNMHPRRCKTDLRDVKVRSQDLICWDLCPDKCSTNNGCFKKMAPKDESDDIPAVPQYIYIYVTKMNLWILFLPKSPQKKCSYALNPLKVFHSRAEN